MANFTPQKIDASLINGGVRYQNGDIVDAEAINAPIEASIYTQSFVEALTDAPDISEISGGGTPSVSLMGNGKYKKFKFSNIVPRKGVDYWTSAEISSTKTEIKNEVMPEIKEYVESAILEGEW